MYLTDTDIFLLQNCQHNNKNNNFHRLKNPNKLRYNHSKLKNLCCYKIAASAAEAGDHSLFQSVVGTNGKDGVWVSAHCLTLWHSKKHKMMLP